MPVQFTALQNYLSAIGPDSPEVQSRATQVKGKAKPTTTNKTARNEAKPAAQSTKTATDTAVEAISHAVNEDHEKPKSSMKETVESHHIIATKTRESAQSQKPIYTRSIPSTPPSNEEASSVKPQANQDYSKQIRRSLNDKMETLLLKNQNDKNKSIFSKRFYSAALQQRTEYLIRYAIEIHQTQKQAYLSAIKFAGTQVSNKKSMRIKFAGFLHAIGFSFKTSVRIRKFVFSVVDVVKNAYHTLKEIKDAEVPKKTSLNPKPHLTEDSQGFLNKGIMAKAQLASTSSPTMKLYKLFIGLETVSIYNKEKKIKGGTFMDASNALHKQKSTIKAKAVLKMLGVTLLGLGLPAVVFFFDGLFQGGKAVYNHFNKPEKKPKAVEMTFMKRPRKQAKI